MAGTSGLKNKSAAPLLGDVIALMKSAEDNFALGPTLESDDQMEDSGNAYLKQLRDLSAKCSSWTPASR